MNGFVVMISIISTLGVMLLFRPLFLWYFKVHDIIDGQSKIIRQMDSKSQPDKNDIDAEDIIQTSANDPVELEAFMKRMNMKKAD